MIHRPWLRGEDRIITRYARLLLRGAYPNATAAARDCEREISTLRADPAARAGHHPFGVIRRRVADRAHELGANWSRCEWQARERRVAERHARAFVAGHHSSIRAAARAAQADLAALSGSTHRSTVSVYDEILQRVRRAGWRSPAWHWSEPEIRILQRYARRLADGRFASAVAASRACMDHFARLGRQRPRPGWLAARRSSLAVYRKICPQARAHGRIAPDSWTRAEERRAEPLVKMVVSGRIPNAGDAARRYLGKTGRARSAGHAASEPRRTYHGVHGWMLSRARELGRGPVCARWRPSEQGLIRRYARAIEKGEYDCCISAARACRKELEQLRSRSPQAFADRSSLAISARLCRLTETRGPASRACRTREEIRLLDPWLNWYERYRHLHRLKPLAQAAEGLQADLEKIGRRRSVGAMRSWLTMERLRRLGLLTPARRASRSS
ncbi:MAG: hypothetical protein NTX53_09655 [candidate division WOR-3 bacterium]|nr:hypothetical protein [candidate division WOR-3 bacterium]